MIAIEVFLCHNIFMATIKKTSYSITRSASKEKLLVVFCILFVVFCALSCLFITGYIREKYRMKIKEAGVTAIAEIYAVSFGSGHHTFQCYYSYIDENGIKYWSVWGPEYTSREEAEKNLGKQIEIFIDGKGESMPIDWEPSFGWILTSFIVSVVLVCVDTVGIVILSIKIHKERKLKNAKE